MTPASLRALLLDLDGVVYLERRLLPRAARAIAALRAAGLRVGFITNNANYSRAQFATRLTAMGIPAARNEVMNAADATARWLAARLPRGARVMTFGRGGLARELKRVGLASFTVRTQAAWLRFRRSGARPKAVAVVFDKDLSYWQLCAAHLAVARGAWLVASNHDPTYPVQDGTQPGTGSLVKQLETSTGVMSRLVGKPSPLMVRLLLAEMGIRPRDALMVGDRLAIDAAAGRAAGTRTALVLTGVDTRADVARTGIRPDLIAPDLWAVARHVLAARRRRTG